MGCYSDITVKFNNKEYKLHLLLLKAKSKYFNNINNKQFVEYSNVEILFEQLNGKLLDTKYFDSIIHCIYGDTFNVNNFFDFSTIPDIVEYYRLLDYLQFDDINKFKLSNAVVNKLNKYIPVKNNVDDIIKQYIDLTFLRNIGKTCCTVQNNSCDRMIGVTCWNGCGLSIGYNNPRNLIYNQVQQIHLDKPYDVGLIKIDFYEIDNNLTRSYVEYLFKLVDSDLNRYKIIGISNLQIKDLDFLIKNIIN